MIKGDKFIDSLKEVNENIVTEQIMSITNSIEITNMMNDISSINEIRERLISNGTISNEWFNKFGKKFVSKFNNITTYVTEHENKIFHEFNNLSNLDKYVEKLDINLNNKKDSYEVFFDPIMVEPNKQNLSKDAVKSYEALLNVIKTDLTTLKFPLSIEDYNTLNVTLDPKLYYSQDIRIVSCKLHSGQRKLLESEIRGITHILNKNDVNYNDKLNVLYVGSASGFHISYLLKLFPNINFTLIDPAPFSVSEQIKKLNQFDVGYYYFDPNSVQSNIITTKVNHDKNHSNIIIHRKFCVNNNTLKDQNEFFKSEALKVNKNVNDIVYNVDDITDNFDIFICDLRRGIGDYKKGTTESFIAEDMIFQQQIVEKLRPKYGSILKFRPPYYLSKKDESYTYLKGELFYQAFPPLSSTETRLIVPASPKNPDEEFAKMEFRYRNYEGSCYYHNKVVRNYFVFDSSKYDNNLYENVKGFDGCFDCVAEASTHYNYMLLRKDDKFMNKNVNPVKEYSVSDIMNEITDTNESMKYKIKPLQFSDNKLLINYKIKSEQKSSDIPVIVRIHGTHFDKSIRTPLFLKRKELYIYYNIALLNLGKSVDKDDVIDVYDNEDEEN